MCCHDLFSLHTALLLECSKAFDAAVQLFLADRRNIAKVIVYLAHSKKVFIDMKCSQDDFLISNKLFERISIIFQFLNARNFLGYDSEFGFMFHHSPIRQRKSEVAYPEFRQLFTRDVFSELENEFEKLLQLFETLDSTEDHFISIKQPEKKSEEFEELISSEFSSIKSLGFTDKLDTYLDNHGHRIDRWVVSSTINHYNLILPSERISLLTKYVQQYIVINEMLNCNHLLDLNRLPTEPPPTYDVYLDYINNPISDVVGERSKRIRGMLLQKRKELKPSRKRKRNFTKISSTAECDSSDFDDEFLEDYSNFSAFNGNYTTPVNNATNTDSAESSNDKDIADIDNKIENTIDCTMHDQSSHELNSNSEKSSIESIDNHDIRADSSAAAIQNINSSEKNLTCETADSNVSSEVSPNFSKFQELSKNSNYVMESDLTIRNEMDNSINDKKCCAVENHASKDDGDDTVLIDSTHNNKSNFTVESINENKNVEAQMSSTCNSANARILGENLRSCLEAMDATHMSHNCSPTACHDVEEKQQGQDEVVVKKEAGNVGNCTIEHESSVESSLSNNFEHVNSGDKDNSPVNFNDMEAEHVENEVVENSLNNEETVIRSPESIIADFYCQLEDKLVALSALSNITPLFLKSLEMVFHKMNGRDYNDVKSLQSDDSFCLLENSEISINEYRLKFKIREMLRSEFEKFVENEKKLKLEKIERARKEEEELKKRQEEHVRINEELERQRLEEQKKKEDQEKKSVEEERRRREENRKRIQEEQLKLAEAKKQKLEEERLIKIENERKRKECLKNLANVDALAVSSSAKQVSAKVDQPKKIDAPKPEAPKKHFIVIEASREVEPKVEPESKSNNVCDQLSVDTTTSSFELPCEEIYEPDDSFLQLDLERKRAAEQLLKEVMESKEEKTVSPILLSEEAKHEEIEQVDMEIESTPVNELPGADESPNTADGVEDIANNAIPSCIEGRAMYYDGEAASKKRNRRPRTPQNQNIRTLVSNSRAEVDSQPKIDPTPAASVASFQSQPSFPINNFSSVYPTITPFVNTFPGFPPMPMLMTSPTGNPQVSPSYPVQPSQVPTSPTSMNNIHINPRHKSFSALTQYYNWVYANQMYSNSFSNS